jgi:hypothetical protein
VLLGATTLGRRRQRHPVLAGRAQVGADDTYRAVHEEPQQHQEREAHDLDGERRIHEIGLSRAAASSDFLLKNQPAVTDAQHIAVLQLMATYIVAVDRGPVR